jgi:tetratricopeptide (TPR) repeat protein
LTEALSLEGNPAAPATPEAEARVARFHFRLGSAYFGLGMLERSRAHLERMLAALAIGLPTGGVRGSWRCLIEIARQIGHRAFGVPRALTPSRPLLLDAVSAHDMLMQVHFYGGNNVPALLHCAIAALNLAERLGPSSELRLAYANVQSTAAMLGLRRVARKYKALGETTAAREDEVATRTSSWVRQCVQHVIWGEWDEAESLLSKIILDAREVDYQRREEEGISILAYMRFAQGRYDECRDLYAGLHRSASRGDAQSLCWSIVFRSHTDLAGDRPEAAVANATEGLELVKQLPGRSEAINLHSTAALGHLRLGAWDRALEHARAALDLGCASALIVFMDIVAYSNLAEVVHALSIRPGAAPAGRLKRLEADAFRQLGLCRFLFPIAVARAELWKGVRHWRDGRTVRARAAWQRAAAGARDLRAPHEEAQAELFLALYPARGVRRPCEDALEKAASVFRGLGAVRNARLCALARLSDSPDPFEFRAPLPAIDRGRP